MNINSVDKKLINKVSLNVEKYIPFPYYRMIYSVKNLIMIANKIKAGQFTEMIDNNIYNKLGNYEGTGIFPTTFNNKNVAIIINSDWKKYGWTTDYFTEDVRIKCKNTNSEYTPYQLYKDPKYNKQWIAKVYNLAKYKKENPYIIKRILEKHYPKSCLNFPIPVIYGIYDYFKPKKILDISAGWGDRLIASTIYNPELYVGVDPNTDLFDGYNKIIKTLGNNKKNKFIMINDPFEDAKIPNGLTFDMMFSSPPFFIAEIYSEHHTQSFKRYKTLDDWLNKFLYVSFRKAWDLLDNGGYFIFALNDVRIGEKMVHFTEKVLTFIKNNLKGSNYKGVIKYRTEYGKKSQPLWVWRKQ